jgi:ribosomal protein S21
MAQKVRAKVVNEDPNSTKNFRSLLSAFKKKVTNAGIISECKRREYFESPGEKRRRKKKEMQREHRKKKRY